MGHYWMIGLFSLEMPINKYMMYFLGFKGLGDILIILGFVDFLFFS